MATDTHIKTVLSDASEGDERAQKQLYQLVYEELRLMAHRSLGHRNGQQTLCTTALVNEAYLKLAKADSAPYRSKAYFFGAASQSMRQIIIDLARKRNADKRAGERVKLSLDVEELAIDQCAEEILELDEALKGLASIEPRLSQIIECRFFGGLTADQTAEIVGVGPRTVHRDWRKARAWLYLQLQHGQEAGPPSANQEL